MPGVFSSFEEFLPCFPELSGYSGEETDGKEPKDKKMGGEFFSPLFQVALLKISVAADTGLVVDRLGEAGDHTRCGGLLRGDDVE